MARDRSQKGLSKTCQYPVREPKGLSKILSMPGISLYTTFLALHFVKAGVSRRVVLSVTHIVFLLSLLLIVDYLVVRGYVSEFTIPKLERFVSAFLNFPTNPDIPGNF